MRLLKVNIFFLGLLFFGINYLDAQDVIKLTDSLYQHPSEQRLSFL